MDLLDRFRAASGDQDGARTARRFGTQGWDASPLLLDRMHPPHGQADKPFAEIHTRQTI
jgi:hypothetical protein